VLPLLGLHLQELGEAADAGVVNKDVNRAELLVDFSHRNVHGGAVGYVGHGRDDGAPGGDDFRGYFLQVAGRAGQQANVYAFGGESQGYGAADAFARTSNEGDFSLKGFHRRG